MPLARSKVTAQGQISIPANVRQRLGIGPGSILEWEDEGDRIVIRRSTRFSSEQIHQAIFAGQKPEPRTINEMREGIKRRTRERYARR